MSIAFALFDSPVGRCGIAWSEAGIVGLQLPEHDDAATRSRLLRGRSDAIETAPPGPVAEAIGRVVGLLHGNRDDLASIVLDLDGVPAFQRRVYELARAIPVGGTLTYGDIAGRLGDPTAAQAVGQALGRNPIAIVVPCHRVVAAGGKAGGFSARGGRATKLRILALERAGESGLPLFDARRSGAVPAEA